MITTFRDRLALVGVAGLLAATAACGDAPMGPDDPLVAVEAEAALAHAEELPTLPRMIERAREAVNGDGPANATVVGAIPPALERAERRWHEARNADPSLLADALREAAYAEAAPALAAALDDAALRAERQRMHEWIATASRMVRGHAIAEIERALADAEELLEASAEADAAGERARAIELMLRAADRLRATTPPAVAERLIGEAVQARAAWLGALGSAEDEDATAFRRAERLLDGARRALDEADYVRAIRRAYYAIQLFEGR